MDSIQKQSDTSPPLRTRKRVFTDRRLTHILIWPTIVWLMFIGLFPLGWSVVLSFTKYNASSANPPEWVGTRNYSRLLDSETVWYQFTVTGKFVALAVALEFIIGFGLALLLTRKFRGRGTVLTLMLLPMMLAPAVVGLFWKFMLNSQWGIVNWFLGLLGIPPADWLNDKTLSLISIALVDTWMWSPFILLISLAGLSAVPRYLYEAADVDRASGWFKFRRITLPMIWPLLLIALLMRTMDAFKLFDLAYVMTGGGPGSMTETISLTLYRFAFLHFNTGVASALGYIILFVVIGLSSIYIRFLLKAQAK